MAEEAFAHTTAAEMEEFLSRTDAEQKLRIWLNGRETNGHVADAFDRIDALGTELQKVRLDLSAHVERPHVYGADMDEIVRQHRDLWSVWRFGRWFIPISIPISIGLVTAGFALLRLVGVGS